MKLGTLTVGGIGLSLVVALFALGACGGDNSAVTATGGSANAGTGGSENGGSGAGTGGTVTAGGANGTGGSSAAGNPYSWGFYQDTEGWGTGTIAGTATATAASPNATGTYCNGGCADIVLVFAGEATQTVNFMKYYGPPLPYPDFTGKTLTAGVKIDDPSGVISDIEFHPQSGTSYTWGQAAVLNPTSTPTLASVIASTTAVTISTPIAGTSPFDPTQIQGIGFNINGAAGKSGTAHLYVDSVTVQ